MTDLAPPLVAHRGYAGRYPENTLPAVEAALRAGAGYVEVDVQLTADGVPVLFHDLELGRTTGAAGRITGITLKELARLRAGETARFGPRFRDIPVPTLAALVELLRAWPGIQAFIEIKRESLAAFGTEATVARVLDTLAPCHERCVPISFDQDAVIAARAYGAARSGWVITAWSEAQHDVAEALSPDYIFCNHTKLPAAPAPLWPGPWRWVFYEVADPALAHTLARRGPALIETMALDAYAVPPWSLRIDGD